MRFLALLALIAILLIHPAQAAKPLHESPEAKAVETYLTNFKAVKSRFIQTANDGTQTTGDFMLKRPGRMRFQYDAPLNDFITADGMFIYYYDAQLQEQKNAPIGQSLADFFLRQDVSLNGDISVTDIRRSGGLLQVTVTQAKDPLAGSLVLGFKEKPKLELKKWRVVDAQGAITEVELHDMVTGIKLENDVFRYYDPKRKTPKYN